VETVPDKSTQPKTQELQQLDSRNLPDGTQNIHQSSVADLSTAIGDPLTDSYSTGVILETHIDDRDLSTDRPFDPDVPHVDSLPSVVMATTTTSHPTQPELIGLALELERLHTLYEIGGLSEDEFALAKARVIGANQ